MIRIAKKLENDIHLIILATEPEEQKINDLIKTLKNIHYLGYTKKEETLSLIQASDILIQPSLKEGISSTLLEAMACKTAIIASSVGGNSELVENEVNGILVEPQDDDSFVEQITSLLNNEQLRKSFVENALKTVKKYDWNQVGNLYLSIYESIPSQSK